MILFIDAFNLMYKFPELEDLILRGELENARRELLKMLLQMQKRKKKPFEVHLFLDGKKSPGIEIEHETLSGVHLHYSLDRSADYLIRKSVQASPSPGEIRVVSSDKEVIYFAKKGKCHVQSSEEFAAFLQDQIQSAGKKGQDEDGNLAEDAGESTEVSDEDLAYWSEVFSKNRRKLRKKE